MAGSPPTPKLSLLVPVFGNARHAENTLISLSAACQRNVTEQDYEIIVVEAVSDDPLGEQRVRACGKNLVYLAHGEREPARLASFELAYQTSRAPLVGFVDSPSVVTPRLVEHALGAAQLVEQPVLVVPAYEPASADQPGPEGRLVELARPFEHMDWKSNAYELFEVARFSATNSNGFLCGVQEAELFFCTRSVFERLRSERWAALATPDDLFAELLEQPDCGLVVLAGEGCFRQRSADRSGSKKSIWLRADREPLLYGVMPGQALDFFRVSIYHEAIHESLAREHGMQEWRFERPLSTRIAPREQPAISIVVVIYRIPRQAENTIYSLTAQHQRNVVEQDYEIIVVENRSSEMLGQDRACRLGGNVRYFERDESGVSPAPAVNFGASQARGRTVALMIDGARMATPRLVEHALMAQRVHARPICVAPGYHLGPGMQHVTSRKGYDESAEQKLLASVDWKQDGYRLFEIGSFDEATQNGFLNPMLEATCIFCPKTCFEELGGMDERFDLPGGGEVNHDFFERASRLPGTRLVVLWGEGTFHQYHGGVSSAGAEERDARLETFRRQYDALRGRRFATFEREPLLVGVCPARGYELLMKATRLGRLRFGMLRTAGRAEWPNG